VTSDVAVLICAPRLWTPSACALQADTLPYGPASVNRVAQDQALVRAGPIIWAPDRGRVDMRMMAARAVWTTNLAGFLLGVGMYASIVVIPAQVELPRSTGFGFGGSAIAGWSVHATHRRRPARRRAIHGLPTDPGFTLAFGVCGLALLAGVISTCLVPRARLMPQPRRVAGRRSPVAVRSSRGG
jgi:hypothetical protein